MHRITTERTMLCGIVAFLLLLIGASYATPAYAAELSELPAAYPAAPDVTNVCGAITSNTTWTTTNSPYVMTCRVTVNSGVTLTVEPGVVIKGSGVDLVVAGTLVINGTESQPVYITSYKDDIGDDTNGDGNASTPAAGDWYTLWVESTGSLTMHYTTVRYGGADYGFPTYQRGNVFVSGGQVTLDHSTLAQSAVYGLYAVGQATVSLGNSLVQQNASYGIYLTDIITPVITSTNFISNTNYAIYMDRSVVKQLDARQVLSNTATGNSTNGIRFAGTLNGESFLVEPGMPYVNGGITLQSDSNLTIGPGVIIKSSGTSFTVNGDMQVNGAEAQPVYFTSLKDDTVGGDTNNNGSASTPAAGDWYTLWVESTGSLTMHYTTVRYGGADYGFPTYQRGNVFVSGGQVTLDHSTLAQSDSYGLYAVAQATVSLGNNLVQRNTAYGIYLTDIITPVITSTNFMTNTNYPIYMDRSVVKQLDARQVLSNTASGNSTNGIWFNGTLNGESYLVEPGMPYVNGGITLQSDSNLTIGPGVIIKSSGTSFYVDGDMHVNGTEAQPVYFTSLKDDVGGDTNGNNSVNSPAAGDWYTLWVGSTGSLTMHYTTVRYGGANYGFPTYQKGNVFVSGGQVTLDHSTLAQSDSYGLYAVAQATVSLGNSLVQQNTVYGIYLTDIITPVITSTNFMTNTNYAIYMDRSVVKQLDARQVLSNTASGNSTNGIWFNGTLNGESYLVEPGMPYVNGGITLQSDGNLTVGPGVIIKSNATSFYVNGDMQVNGAEAQPVYFTSLKDDVGGDTNGDGNGSTPAAGNWYTLWVNSTGSLTMHYTTVRYGGADYGFPTHQRGNVFVSGGQVTLNHSTLARSDSYGLYAVAQATVSLGNSLVQQNTGNGVSLSDILTPVITNTNFISNTNYAVWMTRSAPYALDARQVLNNTASGNGTNGIYLQCTLTGESALVEPGMPYVNGGITLQSDGNLTVGPGVVIKSSGTSFYVNGDMQVNGTQAQPVYFTSLKDDVGGDTNGDNSTNPPAASDWYTLWVNSTGSLRMHYTTVRYGGADYGFPTYQKGNVFVTGGEVILDHSALTHGAAYGLRAEALATVSLGNSLVQQITGNGVSLSDILTPVITNTNFMTNTVNAIQMTRSAAYALDTRQVLNNAASGNGTNGIWFAGTLNGESHFVNTGIPYVWSGVSLATDSSIYMGEGVIAKLLPGTDLQVSGELTATGTLTNPVIFTSFKDDTVGGDTNADADASSPAAGDWYSLVINPTGRANFRHVTVSYGGADYGFPNYIKGNIWVNGGTLDMENGASEYGYYGVYVNNGHAAIHYTNLENNTTYGVYNAPGWTELVDATWNWWGAPDGPQLMDVVNVSSGVDYEPYNSQTIVDEPVEGLSASSDAPTEIGAATNFEASVSDGTNVQYTWDFGDGSTLTGATPSHNYTEVNTYTVVVTASNSANWITSTFQAGVIDAPIEGLATQTSTPTGIGDTTYFTATLTNGSNVTYAWNFGDGSAGNSATPSHTYASLGDYTVVVTASNTTNWVTSTLQTSVVDTPIAGLEMQTSSPTGIGGTTYFTATITDGSNVTYAWNFGDSNSSSGASTSHVYATSGTYTTTVTATNSRGSSSIDQSVQVGELQIVGLTAEVSSIANLGQPVSFTASVTNGSGVNYSWDFGDGQTGSGASVEHTYTAPGVYHVTLTATNPFDVETYEFDITVNLMVFLPLSIR